MPEEEAEKEVSLWLGFAPQNVEDAVAAFMLQWIPWPRFDVGVEVMDKSQLRDAMGIRATDNYGDSWPKVERMLLDGGYRWQMLGGTRVMFLKEKDDFVPAAGWEYGEEL